MMIGTYPCCDVPLMIAMPERTPAYARDICPGCGAVCWHHVSRVDPWSMTEDEFLAKFVVDDVARTITPRAEA